MLMTREVLCFIWPWTVEVCRWDVITSEFDGFVNENESYMLVFDFSWVTCWGFDFSWVTCWGLISVELHVGVWFQLSYMLGFDFSWVTCWGFDFSWVTCSGFDFSWVTCWGLISVELHAGVLISVELHVGVLISVELHVRVLISVELHVGVWFQLSYMLGFDFSWVTCWGFDFSWVTCWGFDFSWVTCGALNELTRKQIRGTLTISLIENLYLTQPLAVSEVHQKFHISWKRNNNQRRYCAMSQYKARYSPFVDLDDR